MTQIPTDPSAAVLGALTRPLGLAQLAKVANMRRDVTRRTLVRLEAAGRVVERDGAWMTAETAKGWE
jgi:hypothetical protein